MSSTTDAPVFQPAANARSRTTRLGIRAKIVLIATSVMLMAYVAISASSSYLFSAAYTEALEARAFAVGVGLRVQLDRLLLLGLPLKDISGFDEQCREAIESQKGIDYAMVVAPDGGIRFHSDSARIGTRVSDRSLLQTLSAGRKSVFRFGDNGKDMFLVVVPVLGPAGGLEATVVVGFSAQWIAAENRRIAGPALLIAVLCLVVAVALLIAALSVTVTRPIDRLIRAVEQIKDPQSDIVTELDIHSNDEIGDLATNFTSMARRLKNVVEVQRQRAAAEAKASAQATRSAELATAVSHLEQAQDASLNLLEDLNRQRGELEAEVKVRKQAEALLQATLQRKQAQFEVVGKLSEMDTLTSTDVDAIARRISELAAQATGCARVNVWLFNDDRTVLRCVDLFEAAMGRHSSGATLDESEYRNEFQVLRESRYVDADDPLTDPRTSGYVEGYLKPLRITAMLDAAINVSGQNVGLLCLEHVDRPHHWEDDEIAFACQLADKIALTLLNRLRAQADQKVRTSEAELSEAQAIAHVGRWELDLRSGAIEWSDETYRIFGVDRSQFIPTAEAVLARIQGDDRAAIMAQYSGTGASGSMQSIDARIVMDDGCIRVIHQRGQTLGDEEGRPLRRVGTVQDVTDRKRVEDALRQEHDFSAALIESLPGFFVLIDEDGRFTRWNENVPRLIGMSDEQLRGRDVASVLAEQERDQGWRAIRSGFDNGAADVELNLPTPGGLSRVTQWTGRRITRGDHAYLLAVGTDVTDARAAEARLRASEERFRAIFNTVSDSVFVHDPRTGAILDVNQSVEGMFGYSREEVIRGDVGALSSGVPPYTQADAMIRLESARTGVSSPFEWRFRARDGRLFWGEVMLRRASFGGQDAVLATVRDITERKSAEEQMIHTARHDGLTGLANRAVFVEMLEQSIAQAHRGGPNFALLYLDLDHFKDVNDTLGHPIGDLLLKGVAERLRSVVRTTDVVARFGGDEFALIASGVHEPADAAVMAEKVLKTINEPFSIAGNEIRSGASVGVAVYGADAPDAEALLSHADVALYRAKADGRGTFRFFTEAMDAEVRQRVALNAELRDAISAGQLFLVYQPQVNVETNRIVGLEALVRWKHPSRGLVPPSEFVPIAERSGLIVALGHWVLREACRQTKEWLDAGIDVPLIAVNLSSLQFRAPLELEKDIATTLRETGLPPRRLELELTESVLMEASREHNDVLLRLRNAGMRLAIDDFGTGYSSLEYLSRFPVDRVKIAQVFMVDLHANMGNAAIVRAAIGLAIDLKLDVVVEGVETIEQLELVRAWSGANVQGYYFSRPLPASEAAALLGVGRIDRQATMPMVAAAAS